MWPRGWVEVWLYSSITAALERDEWSAARPGRNLPPGKTRYPFYRRLCGPQGRSGRVENLAPTGIFFLPTYFYLGTLCTFQHLCNSYCQHRSCSQSVHRTRYIITPHITVPFDLRLSHTLFSTPRTHFPAPSLHTAQECKVGTLCGPCTTLSHNHSST
jgi:hypothetical protein